MDVKATLQGLGAVMLGILGVGVLGVLAFGFIAGAGWLSERVYPLMMPTLAWTLIVCVVVLLPAALIRPLRGFASVGLFIASYVFGFLTWIWSFIVTLIIWGYWGVIIGLFFAGVGIVPVAFIAMLFHGEWHHRIWDLLLMIVLTFGTRVLAFWVATKAEPSTA